LIIHRMSTFAREGIGIYMKTKALFAAAIMFLMPTLVFARQKDSVQVQFQGPVNVAGKQLAAGQYKLTWQGTGPDVTVNFIEHRKIVASVPANLVSDPDSQSGTYETEAEPDKTVVLQAVDLNHESIRFQDGVSAAGN
jgi:hypothetical protein